MHDYEIKYIDPPISEVVKVFKTEAYSGFGALADLIDELGHYPADIISIKEV